MGQMMFHLSCLLILLITAEGTHKRARMDHWLESPKKRSRINNGRAVPRCYGPERAAGVPAGRPIRQETLGPSRPNCGPVRNRRFRKITRRGTKGGRMKTSQDSSGAGYSDGDPSRE